MNATATKQLEPILGRKHPRGAKSAALMADPIEGFITRPMSEPHRTRALEKLGTGNSYPIRIREDLDAATLAALGTVDGDKQRKTKGEGPRPFLAPYGGRHDRATNTTQPQQIHAFLPGQEKHLNYAHAVAMLLQFGDVLEEAPQAHYQDI